jgi:ring-1,2-phenylacetyl-CoA epoxidase subunit PaaB
MSQDADHIQSLDPRVTRLHIEEEPNPSPKPALDQLENYEVFHQKKESSAYTYVGPVHAANEEIAFLYGKEQYSRRAMCSGMMIAKTQHIFVSGYADDNTSVYDSFPTLDQIPDAPEQPYEIFHLKKRGKAHQHAGTVLARSIEHALDVARQTLSISPVVNVWVVASQDVLREEQDKDMWATTQRKSTVRPLPTAYKTKLTASKPKDKLKNSCKTSR